MADQDCRSKRYGRTKSLLGDAVITADAPSAFSSVVDSHFVDHDGDMKLDFEEFVAMQPTQILEHHTRMDIRKWYDDAVRGWLSILRPLEPVASLSARC
jgi:hypothetical protein